MLQRISDSKIFSALAIEDRRKTYLTMQGRLQLPVEDNGENIVELKSYFAAENEPIILASVWDLKKLPSLWLRETVASKLILANRSFKGDYRLKITDALRPLHLQREAFEQVISEIKTKQPDLSLEDLRAEAAKFVADPEGYPPHSTGGAVDLTLTDRDGNEIDMGTPVDSLDEHIDTMNESISEAARQNRVSLLKAMEAQGFANLASEWWHYSYGEQYWAAFYSKPAAIYGKVEKLPPK